MSNMFDEIGEIVKREMVMFFLVDCSGSMHGTKIGAVNTAIREVLPEMRTVGGSDAAIKIATLLFSNGFRWMYPEPVPVEDFQWTSVDGDGMTDLGAACEELVGKLSKDSFLSAPSGSVAPVIFLMSDGQPTDDFERGLEKLWANRWFQHSIKVAVAIGDDADLDALEKFTGSSEAVIRTHTPEALRKMVRFVTVTSSKVGSKSQGLIEGETKTKQQTVEEEIKDYLIDNTDIDQNAADEWE